MKRSLGAKTLLVPTPVVLVGTYDADDKPNLMTAAWSGVCCSKPPCVSVALRRATYTYAGLEQHKAFTLGIPSADQVEQADYLGIYSGRDEDKFEALGWTAVSSQKVDAPYAQQVPLLLECKLLHTLEIGLHTLFVGEILDVKAEQDVLDDAGHLDLALLQPLAYAPVIRRYHALGPELGRSFHLGKKQD